MTATLADYQNVLGYGGLVGANPYLTYQGQIPMAGYMGTPTNAQGQPIQSYLDALNQQTPGTTINSSPAAPAAPSTYANPNQALIDQIYRSGGQSGGGFGGQGSGTSFGSGVMLEQLLNQGGVSTPAQSAAAAPTQTSTPASGPDMRQAYLSALANPGKVTTPGAVMQPGATATGTPQPSVLAQFLQQHQGGGSTGAGGYTNQPFFQTLNALQAQKAAGT